jgi:UDP-N-acetyl-D-mannosaminuronic acid dehydrogenase
MKISVLGLGYIGLPTALLFARSGHEVVGVDVNREVIDSLNAGQLHIDEKGLQEVYDQAKGRFCARNAVEESDVFVIAVPTPLNKSLRVADLSYIRAAAAMVATKLKHGNLVVLESTVPPGASERILFPILEKSGLRLSEFHYAHCPERAIPGNTIHEMVNNDRIIGGIDQASGILASEVYSSFVQGSIYLTGVRNAEFIKLLENTYRDVNIALANELAKIAEESGINIWNAIRLANKHPRCTIHQPGPGVGGHCIAIDPWFLTENSTKTGIIHLSRDINDSMPNFVIQMLRTMLKGVKEPVITIFGVSYKGDVGDTRESPALKFIQLCENEGYSIKCHDPFVHSFEYPLFELESSLSKSDCIVLISDHTVFRHIDPAKVRMRRKNVIDTRNILDSRTWKKYGFKIKIMGNGEPESHDAEGHAAGAPAAVYEKVGRP